MQIRLIPVVRRLHSQILLHVAAGLLGHFGKALRGDTELVSVICHLAVLSICPFLKHTEETVNYGRALGRDVAQ